MKKEDITVVVKNGNKLDDHFDGMLTNQMIVDAFYEGYSSCDDENIIENMNDAQILDHRDISFENVLEEER